MKDTSPLRQKLIGHLTLRQLAPPPSGLMPNGSRDFARLHKHSPHTVGRGEIAGSLLHLINERKLSPSAVNVVVNALRTFHGSFLGRETESLLAGIKRPARHPQRPRVFSPDEVERLRPPAKQIGQLIAGRFLRFLRPNYSAQVSEPV